MASAHVLTGLMKWLGREEWRDPFNELLERHLGPACEAAGITLDELAGAVGDHHATVLWGCIFEDFLASDLDDGSNIIDDYLKRRGWKESVPNKRYLTSLRSSVMSLYEVSDIVRDQSFLARDLLRDGEPVRVSEKTGTRQLKQWDRLAARIVKVGSNFEMAGGLLAFTHERSELIRKGFAELKKEAPSEIRKRLEKMQSATEVDQFAFDTEILRQGTFLFTNVWLDDALEWVLNPKVPKMVNSDGDEIAYTTVRYPVKETSDRKALESSLTAIPGFDRAGENLWNWSTPAARSTGRATEGAHIFTSSFGDGSVSLGHVELEPKALKLETNSPQRAQRGQALLDPVIGPFVGEPIVESKTVEEMMASPPADKGRAPSSRLPRAEERAIIHETLDRHYRGLLDEPVPMLGNMSPRKAAKTKKGREKLVVWLKFVENSTARQEANSSMAGYDVSWMWDELGVADLRR
jgi:hypothetical protein